MLGLGLLAALTLAGLPFEGAQDDGYWNQPTGNPEGNGSVDVEPILVAPVELWRSDVGELASDPVLWGSTVFIATQKRDQFSLLALEAETGRKSASAFLGRLDDAQVRLAVWRSTVVVLDRKRARGFAFTGKKLRKRWSLELESTSQPAVADGILYVNDTEQHLVTVDLERGRLIGSTQGGLGRPCVSEYWVLTGKTGRTSVGVGSCLKGFFVRKPQAIKRGYEWNSAPQSREFGVRFDSFASDTELTIAYVPEAAPFMNLFYMRADDYAVLAEPGGGPGFLAPAEGRPVAYQGSFYTFGPGGIKRIGWDGKQYTLMKGSSLPPDAHLGPLSRTGKVVYSGNLAFDLERRRLIWLKADMPLGGPLIPFGDGRGLRRTEDNELVAFGAPGGVAEDAAASPAPLLAARPDQGSGLLLATGKVLLGSVETLATGDLQLTTSGVRRIFEPSSVALVLGTGPEDSERLGDEYPVWQAWRRALDRELAEELAEEFAAYERAKLAGECARLLPELEVLGPDRARDFTRRAANLQKSRASNAGLKRDRIGRLELTAREHGAAQLVVAARWCLDRGLSEAATLLVLDAQESVQKAADLHAAFHFQTAHPPAAPDPLDLPDELSLDALAPASFPFTGEERGELWGRWAREITPARAHFITSDDPDFPTNLKTPWTENSIVLRTPNLVFVSRCLDASIVGPVLRNGEGGIEQLTTLFGLDDSQAPPLQVRLHRNRSDYLAEGLRTAGVPRWSLGYYCSGDRVSRFYVPGEGEPTNPTRIEQTLWQVVVHELTHQFVSERTGFHERSSPTEPGHWVVEGFARFIEHQSVELGRTGRGLTDPTVLSVDLTAQLAKIGALIPLERLLATDAVGFALLDNQPRVEVRPQYSMGTYPMAELSIYYAEAGALCFFIANRCGPKGRDRLLAYLRARYEGRLPKDHWTILGFKSIAELDTAFRAFLADPRGTPASSAR